MLPEQDLIVSLLNLLGVAPPHDIPHPFLGPSVRWRGGLIIPPPEKLWLAYSAEQLEAGARRGGSENHPRLRRACGVVAHEPGADAGAVAWQTELETKRGWDGAEVGCRNDYGFPMHRVVDLVFVRFGSPVLKELAWRSLDRFRFWSWTGAPVTGQRSAVGGREQRGLIDEAADFAAGRGPFPSALPATWDRMLVKALAPELRQLAARPLANPKCAMATPTTLYVGDEAAVAVQDEEVDTNTDAVLVSREEKDGSRRRAWAPRPPWGRIRERASGARVVVSGWVARYTDTSGLFPIADVPLPQKNLKVYHVGSGSILPNTVASPPAPTGPAPDFGPPEKLAAATPPAGPVAADEPPVKPIQANPGQSRPVTATAAGAVPRLPQQARDFLGTGKSRPQTWRQRLGCAVVLVTWALLAGAAAALALAALRWV